MYTAQILSYGNTAQEAAYVYTNLSATTTYYCDPTFTTTTGSTIGFSMFLNSGLTTSAIAGYYSNGLISRYYDGNNTLETATVNLYSSYLVGCCDNKLYKLQSNQKITVGCVLIVPPNNFCYTVVEEPKLPVPYDILSPSNFTILSPEDDCSNLGCQVCPPPPSPPPPGPAIPGVSVNLCDPITLLPMGVKCLSLNPTEDRPNSGTLSLSITGGTAPYTVIWSLPNNTTVTAQTIYNKSVGVYPVTVYDKYGDFSATTTCTLEIIKDCSFSGSVVEFYTPTPTPTPTNTPTPTPTHTPTPTPAVVTYPPTITFFNFPGPNTKTSITVGSNVYDGGSPLTSKVVYYSTTNTHPSPSDSSFPLLATSGTSYNTVTGLTSGTGYYFSIYATNINGTDIRTYGSKIYTLP